MGGAYFIGKKIIAREICTTRHLYAAWAFLFIFSSGFQIAPADDAGTSDLRVVSEGYRRNRDSFPFVSCDYVISRYHPNGSHANLSPDVLAHPVEKATGIWLVNRRMIRSQLTDSEGRPPSHFTNTKYLIDGDLCISYCGHFAELFTADTPFDVRSNETPFDCVGFTPSPQVFTPSAVISNYLADPKGNGTIQSISVSKPAGENDRIFTIQVDEPEPKGGRVIYKVDAEKGFLPIEMLFYNKRGLSAKLSLSDIRKCSGGRYFPMRSQTVAYPKPGDMSHIAYVVNLLVTTLDVDSPRLPKIVLQSVLAALQPGFRTVRRRGGTPAFVEPSGFSIPTFSQRAVYRRT